MRVCIAAVVLLVSGAVLAGPADIGNFDEIVQVVSFDDVVSVIMGIGAGIASALVVSAGVSIILRLLSR